MKLLSRALLYWKDEELPSQPHQILDYAESYSNPHGFLLLVAGNFQGMTPQTIKHEMSRQIGEHIKDRCHGEGALVVIEDVQSFGPGALGFLTQAFDPLLAQIDYPTGNGKVESVSTKGTVFLLMAQVSDREMRASMTDLIQKYNGREAQFHAKNEELYTLAFNKLLGYTG